MNALSLPLLFIGLIFCALALVTAQHKERLLYIELENATNTQKLLEQEYGQLVLEQSAATIPARVEHVASHSLKMRIPTDKQVELLPSPQF